MPTTTPYSLSPEVLAFAATISADAPEYVAVSHNGAPLDCFNNCAAYVAAHGGSTVLGWAIWERAGAYLEAEHHSVVRTLDGKLIDVTPHDGETHILFVPDASASFNGKVARGNHRFALTPDADAWVEASNQNGELLRKVMMYGMAKMTKRQKEEAQRVAERAMKMQQAISDKHPGNPVFRRD